MPVEIMNPRKLFQRLTDTGFTEIQAEAVMGILREGLEAEPARRASRSGVGELVESSV